MFTRDFHEKQRGKRNMRMKRFAALALAALLLATALSVSSGGTAYAEPPGADNAGFVPVAPFNPEIVIAFCTPGAADGQGVCFAAFGGSLTVANGGTSGADPDPSSGFSPAFGTNLKGVPAPGMP
jgi:hypothetical protein